MTTSNDGPPVTNSEAELSGSLSLLGNLSVKGNIGIGTTSPETKLDVQGIIRTYNKDNSGATWDNIQIWSDGTHGHIESNGDENGLRIKSNTAGKIILDSDVEVKGNIGIGTTSPETKLDVQGIIRTYNKDNSGATWDNIQIWSDGTHGHIESNGDEDGLRIKSNTAGKIILESDVEVEGTLKLNSDVAVNEFSNDENLGNSDSAVSTQKAVKTYVDNKINDLELKISDLESKNNNLESKISDLESKINNLESKINNIDFKNLDVTTLNAEKITIGVSDFHFVLEVLYQDKQGKRIDGHRGLALRKRGNPEKQGFLIETDGSMRDRTDISILTE